MKSISELYSPQAIARHGKLRDAVDQAARVGIGFGGMFIIIAVTMIFFYLAWVVLPIFSLAHITKVEQNPLPGDGQTWYLSLEEQNEYGVRLTDRAEFIAFNAQTGQTGEALRFTMPRNQGASPVAFAKVDDFRDTVAVAFDDHSAMVARLGFKTQFGQDGERRLVPEMTFPAGEAPLALDTGGRPIKTFTMQADNDGVVAAVVNDVNAVYLTRYERSTSLLGDGAIERSGGLSIDTLLQDISHVLLFPNRRHLVLANDAGTFEVYDISQSGAAQLIQRGDRFTVGDNAVRSIEFLLGGGSLLVGDSAGELSQWFFVRTAESVELRKIRSFKSNLKEITVIAPEKRRRGFLAADAAGSLGIYYTTSRRTLIEKPLLGGRIEHIAISPRANGVLVANEDGRYQLFELENEHPEISLGSLWGKVWYEGDDAPSFKYQSSSASTEYESKFSLTPLTFGTIKAAFYAMLVAIPLGVMGAVYTAYFMSSGLRQLVKPSLEIMEALPTVILGFLAGLWLAPLVEANLPAVVSLLLLFPLFMVSFAFLWHYLPTSWKRWVPDGWHAALLIPAVVIAGWLAFQIGPVLEVALFGGNARMWLESHGITFDQRNSIIIGLAMGFAVIPTIFTIAEDAVFSVPKHLSNGSLALGATQWQTVVRVVLPTASPGIFSAIMMGLGRAVGETMIVLMATGNTAIMDMNIFQGFRALSANIAVEMPETEVNSTHYRVLFLSALVLFMFTLFLNTLAEAVRHRLRKRYANL